MEDPLGFVQTAPVSLCEPDKNLAAFQGLLRALPGKIYKLDF
jgi:hypothetical protein